MTSEARNDEERADKRWDALWTWRISKPTTGQGKLARVVPFDTFLREVGLGEPIEIVLPDEAKIEAIMSKHRRGEVKER